MAGSIVDVVIPTARWEERPRDLLADLARELNPFESRVREILVADGDSVHFAKSEVTGRGSCTVAPAPSVLNGPAINRNKALQHVTADAIVFLDDDVRLAPGWGEQLFAYVDGTDNVDLLGGVIAARHERNWFSQAAEDFVIRHRLQPDGWYLAAAHLVVRRSAMTALGGFNDSFVYGGEDWDLCKRAHMLGLAVGVSDSLRVTHAHPTTWGQLMRKADQYGPAEVGMNVYSEDSGPSPLVESTPNPSGIGHGVGIVGRALRWPALQYAEFRSMGRSRWRSGRSTLLYVPWMARYLRGRRATAG